MTSFYAIDTMLTCLLPGRKRQNRLNGKTFFFCKISSRLNSYNCKVLWQNSIKKLKENSKMGKLYMTNVMSKMLVVGEK